MVILFPAISRLVGGRGFNSHDGEAAIKNTFCLKKSPILSTFREDIGARAIHQQNMTADMTTE